MGQETIEKKDGWGRLLKQVVSLLAVFAFVYIIVWTGFGFDPLHIYERIKSLEEMSPQLFKIGLFLYFLFSAWGRSQRYRKNGEVDDGVLAGLLWIFAFLSLVIILI